MGGGVRRIEYLPFLSKISLGSEEYFFLLHPCSLFSTVLTPVLGTIQLQGQPAAPAHILTFSPPAQVFCFCLPLPGSNWGFETSSEHLVLLSHALACRDEALTAATKLSTSPTPGPKHLS